MSVDILSELRRTPWDAAVFQMDTYELLEPTPVALEFSNSNPGHYTIKVNPLASKVEIEKAGFYYCDTLIEPYCVKKNFFGFHSSEITITQDFDGNEILDICNGAFHHGRFHRDFNLSQLKADERYNNWLLQLIESNSVYSLLYKNKTVGFIAVQNSTLLLHAISRDFQGKGLAKYLWTPVCDVLFEAGFDEISSSISVSNIAVLNLYTSLGFRFRSPVDVYHKMHALKIQQNHV